MSGEHADPVQASFHGMHIHTGNAHMAGYSDEQNSDGGGDNLTNLIVNYLPATMSQEELHHAFASIGPLKSCKLMVEKGTGKSLGYGFVDYIYPASALTAINVLNGIRMQSKVLKVSFARPSSNAITKANLYVKGLSPTCDENMLGSLFQPFGRIINVRILRNHNREGVPGPSKGVGFVRFDKRADAELAIQHLNGFTPSNDYGFGGAGPLVVKFADEQRSEGTPQSPQVPPPAARSSRHQHKQPTGSDTHAAQGRAFPKGPREGPARLPKDMHQIPQVAVTAPVSILTGPAPPPAAPLDGAAFARKSMLGDLLSAPPPSGPAPPGPPSQGYCLFAYNLPPDAEDGTLHRLFGPFGEISNVKVIRDYVKSVCKGYGFVTMRNYTEALAAIAHLNGHPLGNRTLQISFKTEKRNDGEDIPESPLADIPPPSPMTRAATQVVNVHIDAK